MSQYKLRPYPHPGKYEGETMLTPWLHALSMAGCDDESGDVGMNGWAGIFRGAFHADPPFSDWSPGDDLTLDERAYLASVVGAIITEDSQGFVCARFYDAGKAALLEADWAIIAAEDARFNGSEYERGCY